MPSIAVPSVDRVRLHTLCKQYLASPGEDEDYRCNTPISFPLHRPLPLFPRPPTLQNGNSRESGGLELYVGFEIGMEKVNVSVVFPASCRPGAAGVKGRVAVAVRDAAAERRCPRPTVDYVVVFCERERNWIDLDEHIAPFENGQQLYAFQKGITDFVGRLPSPGEKTGRVPRALSAREVAKTFSASDPRERGGRDCREVEVTVAADVGGRQVNFQIAVPRNISYQRLVQRIVRLLVAEAQQRVRVTLSITSIHHLCGDGRWRVIQADSGVSLSPGTQLYALGKHQARPPPLIPDPFTPTLPRSAPIPGTVVSLSPKLQRAYDDAEAEDAGVPPPSLSPVRKLRYEDAIAEDIVFKSLYNDTASSFASPIPVPNRYWVTSVSRPSEESEVDMDLSLESEKVRSPSRTSGFIGDIESVMKAPTIPIDGLAGSSPRYS